MFPNNQYVKFQIGLDITKHKGIYSEQQIKYFENIVEACAISNILMYLHVRKTEKEAFDIIYGN